MSPLRHHPRLRVVAHEKPELLRHAGIEREQRAQRWLYRLGTLAVAVAVLGGSAAIATALVALSRLVGGGK